ncbi:MAG TPA: N-acetylmuramoyl-L-alanine amidase [Chloroflexota bacterium]|nr:N-acetylmuramoyl-L-alanine amidase [Chloroflexota bacterium]
MKFPTLLFAAVCALWPAAALAQTTTAPRPYVVVVVPGHGGDDPGAIYPPNSNQPSIEEKNLTLPIALKLRDRLQAEDVQVVMTRTGDTSTTGEQRAQIAEQAHADVFVAVHVNSYFPDQTVRGAEAQYFSDPALAGDVADGLAASLRELGQTVRTTKDREQDNILSMPGAIVEAGYLSNAADRQMLQTAAYQDAIADGVYHGLLKYAPQIEELKPRIDAYKLAQQAKTAPQRAVQQMATAAHRGGLPGWLKPAGIGAGLAFAWLVLRSRGRRRARRQPGYGVVRYR